MPYENRVQWVNELRSRGMNVIFENGPVFDEARELYNRGRIGLNWSSMDDLNCRAFELPAMKICPVMNYVPDMQRFFEPDEDYLQFTTMREAIEKTMWAKLNPDLASAMAERAYQKVLPHTYDERVTQILKETGFVV
jgi:spore maturation protein CgeB